MKKRSDRYKVNKTKLFLIIFLSIFVFALSIVVWARFIGTSGLKVNEIKIVNKNLPDSFNGLKIIHFSDTHYGRTINKKSLEKIVDRINLINPDLVVFTGDLLDKDIQITNDIIEEIAKVLKKIDSKIGKYAIKGNHDYTSDSFLEIMELCDFTLLEDSYDLVYKNPEEFIFIGGIGSSIKSNIDYDKTLEYFNQENSNKDVFSIMLMHEPDNISELLRYQHVDLVFAGHSHGGQIRIPFIGSIVKSQGAMKYSEEYYKVENTDLYVSFGLGTSTFSFRLFDKPSINFYRLYNK